MTQHLAISSVTMSFAGLSSRAVPVTNTWNSLQPWSASIPNVDGITSVTVCVEDIDVRFFNEFNNWLIRLRPMLRQLGDPS